MTYFSGLATVEEIKTHYRQLALQNHPDRGGDTATMQEINAQYRIALQRVDGQESESESGSTYTYRYDAEREQKVMDKIDELIRSGLLSRESVEAFLIGTWIWVRGDTYPLRKDLKELDFRWHGKRKCWYWHDWSRKYRYSNGSLSSIACKYGAERVVSESNALEEEEGE